MARLGSHFVLLTVLSLLPTTLLGCPETRDNSAQGPASSSTNTTSTATDATSSAGAVDGPPTESSSAVSAVPTGLRELLALAPTVSMKRMKFLQLEHRDRIGVYFGLPHAWYNDDPGSLMAMPRNKQAAGRFVAMRLRKPGLGDANTKRLLERGPKMVALIKPSWEAWSDAKVGTRRWPAKVARGRGISIGNDRGPLRAIALVVEVPGTPAVGVVLSWPKRQPDIETILLDTVRHLQRCEVQVGRGCVPDAP